MLILGAGYTGRHLYATAQGQGRHVLASSRDPNKHVAYASPADRIEFDLARRTTWKNIPVGADLLWCFPATPLAQVQAFAATLGAPPRRIIVLGSTSAYDAANDSKDYPPPSVDEAAPIDLRKSRVQGEEYLRKECGAMLLRVAGIYGPGRNPLDWIRQGRVAPSRKYVNLIHVEDLAAICLLAVEKGQPGEVYNVSDGTPRTWLDIYEEGRRQWNLPHRDPVESTPGKRIRSDKVIRELGARLSHQDLFASLAGIEGAGLIPQERDDVQADE
jgi:nucleoside-diphosphate-sugar epimerase